MALTQPFLIFPDSGVRTGMPSDGANYIPNPSGYSVQMSDMDLDDDRSSSGFLNRNRIRQNVYSVTCSWDRLSDVQLQRLLSACQAESFSLTFRNPLSATTERYLTKSEMYADANKEATLIATEDDSHDWWSFSTTFVEY